MFNVESWERDMRAAITAKDADRLAELMEWNDRNGCFSYADVCAEFGEMTREDWIESTIKCAVSILDDLPNHMETKTVHAVETYHNGARWYEIWINRKLSHMVATIEEARAAGAVDITATPEPRFLVRDWSGRGWCAETLYTSFTAEEREYREDEDDEYAQAFGEWLDSSSAGDEFDNSDSMFTVIRIN